MKEYLVVKTTQLQHELNCHAAFGFVLRKLFRRMYDNDRLNIHGTEYELLLEREAPK